MAFNTSMEPYYIGLCVCIFCGATMALFTLNSKYTKNEDAVKHQIDARSDVSVSYEIDAYTSDDLREITGAAVITEIMEQDGSLPIRVNNELLNNIENVNNSGLKFFNYLKEYGTDYLIKKVSITAKYLKKISIDADGNIAEINYIVN